MKIVIAGVLGALASSALAGSADRLSLAEAETLAIERDKPLQALARRREAQQSQAVAAAQLPDPQMTLGAANFPVDTFDRDQEPMTQLKLGLRQRFPAGDTLALSSEVSRQRAGVLSAQSETRRLRIRREVRQLWLDWLYWRRAIEVIGETRSLFEQLLDTTRSLYEVGRRDQKDVIRAEREISTLENRLLDAQQAADDKRAQLSRYLGDAAYSKLQTSLPEFAPRIPDRRASESRLARLMQGHPEIAIARQQARVADKQVALAEQQYKPDWGVQLDYGIRSGHNAAGRSRADFASVMVTMDLPLFTGQRQDKRVRARRQQWLAAKDERVDRVRQLVAQLRSSLTEVRRLNRSLELYRSRLLPQTESEVQATLNAYRSDVGDFDEVMRSASAALNTELDFQRTRVDRLKTRVVLHYLLAHNPLQAENDQ